MLQLTTKLGISRSEVFGAEVWELLAMIKGANEKIRDEERREWERLRWQTTVIVNLLSTRTINPQDLLRFDWENVEKEEDNRTVEEILEKGKKLRDKLEKKQNG